MHAKNKPVQTRVADSRLHPRLWLWRQLFDKCGAMRERLCATVCRPFFSACMTYCTWRLFGSSYSVTVALVKTVVLKYEILTEVSNDSNPVKCILTVPDTGKSFRDKYSNTSISKLAINDAFRILHNEGFPWSTCFLATASWICMLPGLNMF